VLNCPARGLLRGSDPINETWSNYRSVHVGYGGQVCTSLAIYASLHEISGVTWTDFYSETRSQGRSVSIVTELGVGWPGFDSMHGKEFFFSSLPRPDSLLDSLILL